MQASPSPEIQDIVVAVNLNKSIWLIKLIEMKFQYHMLSHVINDENDIST